jgi:hypothetical protein
VICADLNGGVKLRAKFLLEKQKSKKTLITDQAKGTKDWEGNMENGTV